MVSPTVQKTIQQLGESDLSQEDRIALMTCILDKIQALPIQDIVTFDEQGTILLQGKKLEPDQAIIFRESAVALKDSFARKVINEQVTFEAIKLGVHISLNTDQVMFAKAALWIIQEEKRLLTQITEE